MVLESKFISPEISFIHFTEEYDIITSSTGGIKTTEEMDTEW